MKPPAPGRTATQVFGALAPGRAKLVLEGGDAFEGATFRLNAESVEAGRAKGAILFPDDPCLAPHHATFFYRGGALHVRDEGAPGGVYLRLRGLSVPLRAGDHFAVGERLLRYAGQLPAPPAEPAGRHPPARRAAPGAARRSSSRSGSRAARAAASSSAPARRSPSGAAGCAVNLGDDPHLSQAHAEIVVEQDGTARLRDLGSSNGTYVKIPPHAERELRDGDFVRMGHEVLRVAVAAAGVSHGRRVPHHRAARDRDAERLAVRRRRREDPPRDDAHRTSSPRWAPSSRATSTRSSRSSGEMHEHPFTRGRGAGLDAHQDRRPARQGAHDRGQDAVGRGEAEVGLTQRREDRPHPLGVGRARREVAPVAVGGAPRVALQLVAERELLLDVGEVRVGRLGREVELDRAVDVLRRRGCASPFL